MKKIVTLVVVLLLAAGAVFYVYVRSGFAFGISSQHRLGKLDKVEAYLMKVGLEKDPARLNELSKLVLGKQVLYYYDKGSKSEGKEPTDYVTIVADQAGDVQSYRAQFRPGIGQAIIRMMTGLYWRSVGGDSEFRPGKDGLRGRREDAEISEFATTRTKGHWVRLKNLEKVDVSYK